MRDSYLLEDIMKQQISTIIYLHIPKAGGSTMESLLWRLYGETNIYRLSSRRPERKHDIDALKEMPNTKKRSIKVLTGIMDFGLHAVLPQSTTYITILRHPVDRVVSHYSFVLNTPEHFLHEEVVSQKMGLKEYIEWCPLDEMDNAQTRLISGKDTDVVESSNFTLCTTYDLEHAKSNLRDYFSVVGLLERFDESLIFMKHEFDWAYPFYRRANVNKKKVWDENLSPELIAFIKERNSFDMSLYKYASEIFGESLRQQGGKYWSEWIILKFLNALFLRHPQIFYYTNSLKNKLELLDL